MLNNTDTDEMITENHSIDKISPNLEIKPWPEA